MADKTCPACGESVGEAKAFCPACGHAFVDEQKRTEASRYDQADHTMQMGQTLYNDLLSDMGLNTKQKEPEKRVEVLKPVATGVQVLQPIAQPANAAPPPSTQSEPAEKKSNTKIWVITGIIAVALLLILIVAVAVVGLYLYYRAGRF